MSAGIATITRAGADLAGETYVRKAGKKSFRNFG
jgi:hypothetical protein